MRGDVLKMISSAKDVENAIVLTHNIDFVFIQTVALAAFRRCGHPTLTIFADAACAAESFAYQHPVLSGLGVRYRVVPVAMEPGFRFHPKAVLLSGAESATLLVGSGNLTFGGWRENAEVWLRFDSGQDGTAPFRAFEGYLTEVLDRVPLRDSVKAEVDAAFDAKSKPWAAGEPAGDARLIGRVDSGAALLDRMLEKIGSDPIDELLVCAPYFDDDGVGLRELVTRTSAKRSTVFCQPERSTLTRKSWEPSAGQAVVKRVDFTRKNASGEERSAFVHAKFYAFRREQEVTVLGGSANCSRAALTMSGRVGNAELQATRIITAAQFEDEFLSELEIVSEPIALPDEPASDPDDPSSARAVLRVLAARFEAGSLLAAYTPPGAAVVECLIDQEPARFRTAEKGVLVVVAGAEPRVLVVRARIDGELVESAPAWVDHEHHLRATARGRSLADSIRTRLQPGAWTTSGWVDVLDVFFKHLSYMPTHRVGATATRGKADDEPSSEVEFTATDVFSPTYRSPALGSIRFPSAPGGSGHVQSLQQLLLRWFGTATEEPDGESEVSGGAAEEGDDDSVDRPEQLQVAPAESTPVEITERERRRIVVLLDQIEKAMTSAEFLSERGPEYLAADIKVASVLLRLGLREGWVERKRFFDLTQKLWSSLFFSSEPPKAVGWLEYRAGKAEDRLSFITGMQSAELSAAFIGWKLAAPSDDRTPEAARLALAAVLAVARLPWLWQGGEPEKIAEELAALLSHTADPGVSREDLLRQAEAEWALLLRRGQALRLLEAAVSRMTPAELRHRIRADDLRPGDLLWQGRSGFCVVRQHALRAGDNEVAVLKLQEDGQEAQFKAVFAIPMRALLTEETVSRSDVFGDEQRQVLREFIDELSAGFTLDRFQTRAN